MTHTLDQFPVERGMRLRGLAMTRLETFVDAAFAFSVTLLVISVDDVPRSFGEFVIALKSIPVFLAACAQVFMFWVAHRNWSRVYGLDDAIAVLLTLLLVASLLVMVFPLRIVYGFGAADLTNGWIPAPFELDPVSGTQQIRLIFVMLGVSWALLSGVVVAMFAYTLKQSDTLVLNDAEHTNAVLFLRIFVVLAISGLTSIAIAAMARGEFIGFAGYQYFLLFVAIPLVLRLPRSKRGLLPVEEDVDSER